MNAQAQHEPQSRRSLRQDARVLGKLAACALDPYRPVMAHVVVTRRCNLTCGYCYEADRVSPPVPLAQLKHRVRHLRRLGTVFVTLTGGEPLLHPHLEELVAYVSQQGMTPVMNSNGYLLTQERIALLGDAGLFALQISIDNVKANETTQKSLKPLTPKLKLLAKHARFRVRVNTVLGSGPPEQALEVARAAISYGFDAKCSFVRDEGGALVELDTAAKQIYTQIREMGRRAPRYLSEDFQMSLAEHGTVDWKCRAGARYFTVCENGLVHFCESSYDSPGKPLADYDLSDIKRAFHLRKSCAPTCAVAYAHQASRMDAVRSQDTRPTPVVKECWLAAQNRRSVALTVIAGEAA